jgi:MFS family permease
VLRRDRRRVALAFLVNGALWGSWIGRIPAVANDLGLSEGELGRALVGMAVATVLTLPVAGGLTTRVGARAVTAGGAVVGAVGLTVVPLATDVATLFVTLFAMSVGGTAMDVAMNGQGVALERGYGRPIVVAFHGMWSVGGLLGTAAGGLTLRAGISTATHLVLAAGVLAIAGVAAARTSPAAEVARGGPARTFALPRGRLWLIGGIAFAAALAEGAAADWSGVYLERVVGTSASVAASGYVVFSLAMATARFLGDRVTARVGRRRAVRAGGSLAAAGFGLVIATATPAGTLVGLGLAGLGLAVAMPIAFTSAADVPGMAQGEAVAAVASVGYAGFLVGPPVIGYLAEAVGLRAALVAVVASALVLPLAARILPTRPVGGLSRRGVPVRG